MMTAIILEPAEQDLAQAFSYYESAKAGLGVDFVAQFRRGVDRILEYPRGWRQLDETYRRYRLHRFPYGIVYRLDAKLQQIVIVAVAHLHRKPDQWRERLPRDFEK